MLNSPFPMLPYDEINYWTEKSCGILIHQFPNNSSLPGAVEERH
jgi:hypothetical protein